MLNLSIIWWWGGQLHIQATLHPERRGMGHRTGVHAVAKRRISALAGNQIPFFQIFN
jgi:hypothetical protein